MQNQIRELRTVSLFLASGAISYGVYVGSFWAFRQISADEAAITAAFFFAAITNFAFNKVFVFASGRKPEIGEAFRFLLVLLLNYFLSTSISLRLLKLSMPIPAALALGIVATTFVGYILSKHWIYRRS